MTRTRLWRSFLVLLAFLMGAALAQTELASVCELRAQWTAFFNAGDVASASGLYTSDARLFLPTGDVLTGRDAIASWMQSTMIDDVVETYGGPATMTLLPIRVDVSAQSGYEVGAYSLRARDGTIVDHGDYVTILVPTLNGWRIAYHMTTSTRLGEQVARSLDDGM